MEKEPCTSCREGPQFYCGMCKKCIREAIEYLHKMNVKVGGKKPQNKKRPR